MRIFIVGAGQVGLHIASSLSREGHDLVVVEKDAEKVRTLQSTLDVLPVCGDGCDPRLLRSHGIEHADLFFAVSDDDASNLLGALTARRLGARRCMVRFGRSHFGGNPLLDADPDIVALFPEQLVAEEIQSLTRVPGASKVHAFAGGRLLMLVVRPSSTAPLYDRPLKQVHGPEGWILTGIQRGSRMTIPRGDTVVRRGELVYTVGRSETVQQCIQFLGMERRPTRRVVIAGGGQVGQWLSRLLLEDRVEVAVIQRGERQAVDLASDIPEALVLRGSATDPDLLREAGVEEADYFVAATQDDDTNILSSLLARELGARIQVALYHRPEFRNVMQAANIDLPISPRMAIAGHILRMVHGREIVSLDLVAPDAEVVEFRVPARARVLNQTLRDLDFPKSSIIGVVMRGTEIFVPGGDFQFREGDRALVFTLTETLPMIEKMFRGR